MARLPRLATVPIACVQPGPYQPRQHFEPQLLDELAGSIASAGILQPLLVCESADAGRYDIIAGERRWRAAQRAGLSAVPVLIGAYTPEQALEAALVENVNRADLNPLEEARGYARLLEEFHYLHEEVAAAVGKSRSAITNSLRLLKLSGPVQTWLEQGVLREGHGKILAGLPHAQQTLWAQKVVQHGWSVRVLAQRLKQDATRRVNSRVAPDVAALERQLSERLGCPTSVAFRDGRGALTINFHDLDILQGVLTKIGCNADD